MHIIVFISGAVSFCQIRPRPQTPQTAYTSCIHAGMLAYAPRFSKYIHACACLHVDAVSELPYWFLPNGDGSLSPASWEEMADSPVVSSA